MSEKNRIRNIPHKFNSDDTYNSTTMVTVYFNGIQTISEYIVTRNTSM